MLKEQQVTVRRWRPEDIPAVLECHRAAYPHYPPEAYETERTYQYQLAAFPEGQFLAELDGKVVGYASSLIVQLDEEAPWYTYNEITGYGTFSTHNYSGDTLYGADIAVHPDYRKRGISGKLYTQRRKLLKKYNLRRMIAYGRIPGYTKHAGKLTAEEYVASVINGELKDSSLKAHLRAGYQVKKVALDLMRDGPSLNYATLLEMPNPDYDSEKHQIATTPLKRPIRRIRVCAAQYRMQPISSWEDFEHQVSFFASTAEKYYCHFLLFPEMVAVQLFNTLPQDLSLKAAIDAVAEMGDRYRELFRRLAMKHRLYIIGGSHPVYREGKLYNVAHLYTPTGEIYTQDKLHITPPERENWGIEPGHGIAVFQTPLARIAIQVCYDIEFPEVSRLQALAGAEVLFVPFSTDEKKDYYRVRYTAHARAVENYVYVVIAGNVGHMPTQAYTLNYARSAILTPSDFAFPLEAIAGEADPNVETVVITDLDLSSLALQREIGSVRPLYDRRADLYEVKAKLPVNIIHTD